jgi:hypothetical protein
MPVLVMRPFRSRAFVVSVLGALIVALFIAQALRQSRVHNARRFVSNIQSAQSRTASYGIETSISGVSADQSWRAYCYRERESLIEEARGAAH